MPPTRIVLLILMLGLADVAIAARPVTVKVGFLTKRGQKPAAEDTVVWLQAQSGTKVPKTQKDAVPRYRVTTRSKALIPNVMAIPVGASIQFPNEDPISHNLFSLSPGNSFDLGLYRRGEGKSFAFTKPGIVNVYCNVHPNMSAVIHVVDTPYYAMANNAGVVTFADVAPGKYRVGAWNERAGTVQGEIVVNNDGSVTGDAALTIDGRDFRSSTTHKNKEGKNYPTTRPKDY